MHVLLPILSDLFIPLGAAVLSGAGWLWASYIRKHAHDPRR